MFFTGFASLHRGFHRSAQLIYISTFASFCQALFSFSFENVFGVDLEVSVFFCFSRSSLHIILPKTPFVNTFFRFFSNFFFWAYLVLFELVYHYGLGLRFRLTTITAIGSTSHMIPAPKVRNSTVKYFLKHIVPNAAAQQITP